jgi:hypothetical protein
MWEILAKLIDADKLGGWVRAGVAALLGLLIAKWPVIGNLVGPELQEAAGVLVAGLVVGLWSQITKSDTAKVAMAAKVEAVEKIEVSDPAIVAATPPEVVLKR